MATRRYTIQAVIYPGDEKKIRRRLFGFREVTREDTEQ
jgi:hypothetical protein